MDPKQRYKSKIDGAQIDSILTGADGELLINPTFTIAQAGIGGNHGSVAYAADCWKLVSGTVTAAPGGGLVLNGTIQQTRETAVGFDVVASINVTSGMATATYDDATKRFVITSSGGTIKRAHLGKIVIDDWAAMPPVDGDTEMWKCQWYYYKWAGVAYFMPSVGGASVAYVAFHAPMRVAPSIANIVSVPAVTINQNSGVNDVQFYSSEITALTGITSFEAISDLP